MTLTAILGEYADYVSFFDLWLVGVKRALRLAIRAPLGFLTEDS